VIDIQVACPQLNATAGIAAVGPFISTTSAARTVSAPDIDPVDPFAYLIRESELSDYNGRFCTVERTFARIPADQVTTDQRPFSRPPMHDIFSGGVYAVSFDNLQTSWLFSSRMAVTFVSVYTPPTVPLNQAAQVFSALDGNVFTIGDTGGHTSSNAFINPVNITEATIRSLCTSIVGLSVSGDAYSLTISFASGVRYCYTTASDYVSEGSVGSGSVTFRRKVPAVNANQTFVPNTLPAQRIITTAVAHGGTAGDWAVLWNGDRIIGMARVLAVASNTYSV
jgi:hypothetical protein